MAILLTAQLMAVLDVMIVNVAAPVVRADLGLSSAGLQLVVAGYTISYSTLLITGARLGDRLGHARVFLAGTAAFTALSLACGVAPSGGVLITARIAQGAAAAVMMPQVMTLIQRSFTGAARTRALSLYTATIAAGAVLGQVVGGLLVTADVLGLGWRSVFLVNVPLGVLVAAFGPRLLQLPRGENRKPFDLPGVVGMLATLACVVVPLILGHDLGWPWWAVVLPIMAIPLGLRTVRHERRTSDTAAVLPPAVLSSGVFTSCLGFLLLVQPTYAGAVLVQAVYFQAGLGLGPLESGLLFVAAGAGFALSSLLWRRVPERRQPVLLVAGPTGAALGYLAMAIDLGRGTLPGSGYLLSAFGMAVALGFGVGPVLPTALAGVERAFAGAASGLLISTLQVGQLLGVAVIGSIYFSIAESTAAIRTALLLCAAVCLVAAGVGFPIARHRQAGIPAKDI
jgi:MFS family permease